MIEAKPGEVTFVQVRHDAWCRAQHTQRASDCCCNAELVVVTQDEFVDGIVRQNRKQRRAAERGERSAKP